MPNVKQNKNAISKAAKQAAKSTREVAKASRQATKAARKAAKAATASHADKTSGAISRELSTIVLEHEAERAKAVELAKALCCPNLYPSFGVQDGYASFPTGDSSPFMCELASFNTTDGAATDNLGIPNQESWAFAFRDPRRSLVFYDSTARTFQYTAKSDSGTDQNDWRLGEPIDIDYFSYDTGFEAHGPFLYAGVTEDGPGSDMRFFPGSTKQTLTVSGLPASTATKLTISLLEGDEVIEYERQETSDVSGVASYNFSDFLNVNDQTSHVPNMFFFGNLVLDKDVSLGRVQLHQTAQPVLRQLALADFEDVIDVVEKLRFCSLNLMYSNTAPPLYRNGYCTAWQVPSNLDHHWLMTQGFEYIANRPGADRMDVQDGIHIFWKSTDPVDWEYLEVGEANGATSPSSYKIQSDSDYLAVSLSQPQQNGRAGYFTVFSDVQYRHDSVWFPLRFPDHNRRTFEMALEIQARVPQVHCNPFHIKDIFKFIGNNRGKINSSLDVINDLTNQRAGVVTAPIKKFLDIWFK